MTIKTIGWGLVQIPIVSHYNEFCFFRRDLVRAVSGTGWKLFLQSFLRVCLLSMWGMPQINMTIPINQEKIVGVYIELGILGIQIVTGISVICSVWFENMYMLYPAVGVIPTSFLIDFGIKASCYASLFLWPEVTVFGIFSLIEIWFRYLILMYCWIATISFIYYSKDKPNPFVKPRIAGSQVRTPFSRSSTLSVRGRRSFLLKPKQNPDVLADSFSTVTSQSGDKESSSLMEENRSSMEENRSSVDGEERDTSRLIEKTLSSNSTFRRESDMGTLPQNVSPKKRKGGFMPDVLKPPNEQGRTEGPSLSRSNSYAASAVLEITKMPPTLPRAPPVGHKSEKSTWKSPFKKSHRKQIETSNVDWFQKPNESMLV